jgi:hypothetical protein
MAVISDYSFNIGPFSKIKAKFPDTINLIEPKLYMNIPHPTDMTFPFAWLMGSQPSHLDISWSGMTHTFSFVFLRFLAEQARQKRDFAGIFFI